MAKQNPPIHTPTPSPGTKGIEIPQRPVVPTPTPVRK